MTDPYKAVSDARGIPREQLDRLRVAHHKYTFEILGLPDPLTGIAAPLLLARNVARAAGLTDEDFMDLIIQTVVEPVEYEEL